MTGPDEGVQTRYGEGGGAGEDQIHGRLNRQALLLLELLANTLLFELGEVIDKDFAVEVIDFVLNARREQAFGVEFEGATVAIERRHPNPTRAVDLVVHAGHREAAFFHDLLAIAHANLGVDEHLQGVAFGAEVDHDHALGHIDLNRGQSDARRLIHGFGHVVDQAADLVVHLHDGRRAATQARIGIVEYGSQSHAELERVFHNIIRASHGTHKRTGLGGAGGMDYTRNRFNSIENMNRFRPALALLLSLALPAHADTIKLKDGHPERYTVVKGDTLWGISARFLQDPWRWPRIWNKNAQIKNPHRIYPGDVIVLTYRHGQPELTVLRDEKLEPVAQTAPGAPGAASGYSGPIVVLSPKIHPEPLAAAIPTIPPEAIMPFLSQPLAVDDTVLEHAGYVTVGLDHRLALGNLSRFYARGLGDKPAENYHVFRPGVALRDPDSGKILAYQAIYLGEAKLLRAGDPAKLEVTTVKKEITPGDRLLRASATPPPAPYYYPHAPKPNLHGRIISVLSGVTDVGPDQIVAINLGKRQGVDEGAVFRILYHGSIARDPVKGGHYRIPDEASGLLMVFRTYDRVSYALVMRATRPIHLLDAIETP